MPTETTLAVPVAVEPVRTAPASRFGAPQAFTAVSFPVLGGALHLAGVPLQDIFVLLDGCGALGAAAVVAVRWRWPVRCCAPPPESRRPRWDAGRTPSTTAGPPGAGWPHICACGGNRPP
ncbi:hypothetical protein ACFV9X_13080 [Streptomyces anulatus]|uniref:hypothetical protein n=1 Tax=Streptomyces TaxID=1883 RepID=UPI00093D7AC8|nr:hypothetical protein [Streptomyces sp. TSRI0261]OKJ07665.1 hypothetical protein AMK20_24200 [Streptomyces sp. TSRI0261]